MKSTIGSYTLTVSPISSSRSFPALVGDRLARAARLMNNWSTGHGFLFTLTDAAADVDRIEAIGVVGYEEDLPTAKFHSFGDESARWRLASELRGGAIPPRLIPWVTTTLEFMVRILKSDDPVLP